MNKVFLEAKTMTNVELTINFNRKTRKIKNIICDGVNFDPEEDMYFPKDLDGIMPKFEALLELQSIFKVGKGEKMILMKTDGHTTFPVEIKPPKEYSPIDDVDTSDPTRITKHDVLHFFADKKWRSASTIAHIILGTLETRENTEQYSRLYQRVYAAVKDFALKGMLRVASQIPHGSQIKHYGISIEEASKTPATIYQRVYPSDIADEKERKKFIALLGKEKISLIRTEAD
jgi:hypothetical protein